jgi:hypothetical protein
MIYFLVPSGSADKLGVAGMNTIALCSVEQEGLIQWLFTHKEIRPI